MGKLEKVEAAEPEFDWKTEVLPALKLKYGPVWNKGPDGALLAQEVREERKNVVKAELRAAKAGLATAPCLGIIRVDYDYEAAPGDIDSHESYAYDVFYRVVPGLTFDVCKGIIHKIKRGEDPLTGQLLEDFREAIRYLDEEKEVFGSTRLAPRTGLASTH